MGLSQEIRVFILSLTAPFTLYIVNNISSVQTPLVVLGLEATILMTVLFTAHLCVRKETSADPLYYVFALFSFTSVADLTNALEQDGYVSGFMDFYIYKVFKKSYTHKHSFNSHFFKMSNVKRLLSLIVVLLVQGEPYLSTAYCVLTSYWNGAVNLALLLSIIHCMCNGKPFRSIALVWAGSVITNQVVLIPGIVIGKYAKSIYPAFWRNIAFLVLPIWAAVKLFNRQRELPIIPADKVEAEQKKGLVSRPLDLLLTLALLGAVAFTVFRGFVVLECSLDACFTYIYQYEPYLKDNVAFPKVMMLVFLFYALPLIAACVYGLTTPGCTWMLDWTLFLAGGVAQAQWAHVGASVHSRTPFTYRIPKEEWGLVLTLNLLYMTTPLLLALRCYRDPTFFMKTVPQGMAGNDKKQK